MRKALSFEIIKKDGKTNARTGKIITPHGVIHTPIFMPVGTQASVKAVKPEDVSELGAEIILSNTYHLYLRPGEDIIREAGGLHKFMNWNKPILTDSGGFQVFSLGKFRKIQEEGAHFSSYIDGSRHLMTPENSIEVQHALGSDIIMAFDECIEYPASKEYVKQSTERTARWLRRCKERHEELEKIKSEYLESYGNLRGNAEDNNNLSDISTDENGVRGIKRNINNSYNASFMPQALFGIMQGGMYNDLRRMSAEQIVDIDLPGYAIGGLSVGEPKDLMLAVLDDCAWRLPDDKPRYLMGVGTPDYLIEGVERGIDMFDCVLPTRLARHGVAMTARGNMNIKNAAFARDFTPLDDDCTCPVCRKYSKAYIRHLFKSEEILSAMLLSEHNIHFLINLMSSIRKAIEDGRFTEFKRAFYSTYVG